MEIMPTIKSEDESLASESDLINNLPDDCLFHVFSYLSVEKRFCIYQVCRRWRDFGPDIWQDLRWLDLKKYEKFKQQHSRLVALCGNYLWDLAAVVYKKSDVFRVVADSCENLRRIRIIFQSLDEGTEQWKQIGRSFTSNQKIQCVRVDNIDLFFGYIYCLLDLPAKLQDLDLRAAKSTKEGKPIAGYAYCDSILARFTNLRRLVLHGFVIEQNDLQAIEHMSELRHLELHQSWQDLSYEINRISELTKLEYLSLHRVRNLTDEWCTELVKNNPNIRHLALTGIFFNPRTVREFAKLSMLESLKLRYFRGDVFDQDDFTGFRSLKNFECDSIRDPEVISLLNNSPYLSFLNLRPPENISTRLLDVAHQVVNGRQNIPLHIVAKRRLIDEWERPNNISPLLKLENTMAYYKRSNSNQN